MSLIVTYDGTLSRVRLAVTGLSDLAPVRVERSTNEVTWATVRGGDAAIPTSGAVTVYDYEFAPGVINYYRVVGPKLWDTYTRTGSSTWGSAESGQTYTTAGGASSDYSTSSGTARQSLGSVNVERTALIDVGATDIHGQVDVQLPVGAAVTSPIRLRFAGRATDTNNGYFAQAEIDTSANTRISLMKRVAGTISTVTSGVIVGANAASNWWRITLGCTGSTLTASLRNLTTSGATTTITGTDGSLTGGTKIELSSLLVTGNTNSSPVVVQWDNLVVTTPEQTIFSGSITPTITQVWLKSLARPFLNRPVDIRDQGPISRQPRAGVFDIVGRSFPVAVNDVRRSKQWTIDLRAETPDEADALDLMFASGDTLLVQVPPTGPLSIVQGGYVTVGQTSQTWLSPFVDIRIIEMPCTAVAAPGPDVVGSTSTCLTVLNTYATCADVLLAHPTCADLLELVGEPTDVIVP